MSSNGVMLQDYIPNAINNITERIWCAGAVIPAGKRVVLGNIRNGWREITFTMGPMQDIVGMALVPPEVVAIESIPTRGFGFMPRGVQSMRARGMIDQSAPLPAPVPDFSPQGGQYTVAEAARRARMEQALPADQSRAPRRTPQPPPYQWGGLHGTEGTGQTTTELPAYQRAGARMGPVWPVGDTMMPGSVASRRAITSWGRTRAGFGAGGASEFTVKAAEELDEHLTTNGCAGCDDYKSTLRQLAFKFKAACMTDPGVSGQVSFNISTPLAMTAYGVGTDKALTLVLGAKRTYDGGPCTDDNGACLGNIPQIAQVTPVALGPLINQVVSQVNDQIKTQQASPTATQLARQEALVNALMGAATGLLTALSAALAAATPAVVTKPAAPAPAPAKSGIPWSTIAIGGLIGTTILATGAFIYTHARHA